MSSVLPRGAATVIETRGVRETELSPAQKNCRGANLTNVERVDQRRGPTGLGRLRRKRTVGWRRCVLLYEITFFLSTIQSTMRRHAGLAAVPLSHPSRHATQIDNAAISSVLTRAVHLSSACHMV